MKFASQDIQNKVHTDLIAQCAVEDVMRAEKHKVTHMAAITADIECSCMESREWVELVLSSVSAAGYGTLYNFIANLLNTKDPVWSSQSRVYLFHEVKTCWTAFAHANPKWRINGPSRLRAKFSLRRVKGSWNFYVPHSDVGYLIFLTSSRWYGYLRLLNNWHQCFVSFCGRLKQMMRINEGITILYVSLHH